jgi:hypothetical protein
MEIHTLEAYGGNAHANVTENAGDEITECSFGSRSFPGELPERLKGQPALHVAVPNKYIHTTVDGPLQGYVEILEGVRSDSIDRQTPAGSAEAHLVWVGVAR